MRRSRVGALCERMQALCTEIMAEIDDTSVDLGYMMFVGSARGPVYVGWAPVGGTQFTFDWVRAGAPTAQMMHVIRCSYEEYLAWIGSVRPHHFNGRWFNRTEGFEAAMRVLTSDDNHEENTADGQSADEAG